MATHLPNTIFTAGAERLNSQPEVALYANLMARRQAKQDALDQYYQNLHKSINPAGMRTKDINEGWSKKVEDAQKFYFQNRDAIRKQQTPEQRAIASQYESMHQDLLMDVNKSKEEAAKELELGKQKISGKWNPTDEDLDISSKIGRSIYDPAGYKDGGMTQRYSINDMSLNVPQFDPKQQEEFYKAATQGLTGAKAYNEKNVRKQNGQLFVPYEQTFTPDQVKTIGDRAASLIEGSRPAKVHYEHLMHDPNFLIPANKAYQSVYGDKDMVDTPTKAAQAATIMAAQKERTAGEEIRKDEDKAFNRQLYLANYKHALTQGDKEKADLWIDKYVQDITNNAKNTGKITNYNYANGTTVAGHKIQSDPTLNKAVGFDNKNPGVIIATPDGGYIVAPYKTDAEYKPILKDGVYQMDAERASKITSDQLKLALGKQSGVKHLNEEMSGQPKKKEIKKSDIGTKAAAAGYTTKEYEKLLIKNGVKIVQ